jgi:hypothetical protein
MIDDLLIISEVCCQSEPIINDKITDQMPRAHHSFWEVAGSPERLMEISRG